jgi:uncharacterized protein YjbI with pentapeptide repeats
MIRILNRLTGALILEFDAETLSGANLSGADLSDADLSDADLRRADLSDADLSDADLRRADLSGADLRRADLSDANWSSLQKEIAQFRMDYAAEIPGLIAALQEGKVNGSVYEGACACLVGTCANLKGVDYHTLPHNTDSVLERLAIGITVGQTPENSPVVALIVGFLSSPAEVAQ